MKKLNKINNIIKEIIRLENKLNDNNIFYYYLLINKYNELLKYNEIYIGKSKNEIIEIIYNYKLIIIEIEN